MEQIILTTFTDPMMGLSYEQEPVYEKLAEHYGDHLIFKYVMAGLVRDVSDFMLPSELSLPAAEGIRQYNKRLAGIYKDEESIGGLPINMDDFHLFDENHRSSYPLCIAYKAAQLALKTDTPKNYATPLNGQSLNCIKYGVLLSQICRHRPGTEDFKRYGQEFLP